MWFNHIGDEMERNLIEQYKDRIYKIISRIPYYDKEDLFQVGCIGLIKAYRNYDPSKNVKFFSYAYKYILGEIKSYVRENRNIKISRDLYKLSGKIEEARNIISQKLMRNPTIDEIALFLEMDPSDIQQALINNYNTTSLDKVVTDDENDACLYDVIPDIENMSKEDLLDLKESIDKLDDNSKKLIELRYVGNYTQSETANIMGMTQVQVSRKESKVLQKLYQEIA